MCLLPKLPQLGGVWPPQLKNTPDVAFLCVAGSTDPSRLDLRTVPTGSKSMITSLSAYRP